VRPRCQLKGLQVSWRARPAWIAGIAAVIRVHDLRSAQTARRDPERGATSRRSGMGRGWLVGPAELRVVHGAEERGERVEQRLGTDRGRGRGKS